MTQGFDDRLFELIPHRPPMLLINQVVDVDHRSSSSIVMIDQYTPFYEQHAGVPSWIGLEYMGQTAALIAGYQLQKGLITPHLGFLLGTRSYTAYCEYFKAGSILKVSCSEHAVVGDDLATFNCEIEHENSVSEDSSLLAKATLSVLRRPLSEKD